MFFRVSRGHRHGNPLPFLLFIVVMEALNKMLLRSKKLEMFKGLKVRDGDHREEVSHLFFIDDTLVFYEPDETSYIIVDAFC